MSEQEREIERLTRELGRMRHALVTLIAWMAQSAAAPISRSEAMQLLRMVDGDDQ